MKNTKKSKGSSRGATTLKLGGVKYAVKDNKIEMSQEAFSKVSVEMIPAGVGVMVSVFMRDDYEIKVERIGDGVVKATITWDFEEEFWLSHAINVDRYMEVLDQRILDRAQTKKDISVIHYDTINFSFSTIYSARTGKEVISYCEKLIWELIRPLNKLEGMVIDRLAELRK